jgi:DNA end-binding protein Ku
VRPFWSGTISFGLVTIPVDLYSATRSNRMSLRMLAPDGTPVVRRYFDDRGKPIDDGAYERGYELDSGGSVSVTDEELESLAPAQSRDIDLTRFVDRDSIPALFFERAYILAPAGNTNLAYRLLASTLERTRRAGIASFVMRGKQYVVAITSERGLLRAETLRFAEELRTPESIGLPAPRNPNPKKVRALRAAIRQLHGDAPTARELADEYWKRLESLVATKRKSGKDLVHQVPAEPEQESAEIIDLMAVLRRSLSRQQASNSDDAPKTARSRAPGVAKTRTKSPARKTAQSSARPSARSSKGTKEKRHATRHKAAG